MFFVKIVKPNGEEQLYHCYKTYWEPKPAEKVNILHLFFYELVQENSETKFFKEKINIARSSSTRVYFMSEHGKTIDSKHSKEGLKCY